MSRQQGTPETTDSDSDSDSHSQLFKLTVTTSVYIRAADEADARVRARVHLDEDLGVFDELEDADLYNAKGERLCSFLEPTETADNDNEGGTRL